MQAVVSDNFKHYSSTPSTNSCLTKFFEFTGILNECGLMEAYLARADAFGYLLFAAKAS